MHSPSLSERKISVTLTFSRRVIAPLLAGKLLTTEGGVRLVLGGLGTVGSLLG